MANISYLTTMSVNDGTSGSTRAFDQVVTVEIPSYEGSAVEATDLNATGKRKRYVPGMIDPGKFGFELNWNKSDFTRLQALISTQNTYTCVTPPDELSSSGTTLVVDAILISAKATAPGPNEIMKIKCEAQANGAINIT